MAQSNQTDRRHGERYAMTIPICVETAGIGATIDVSASGVAFVIDAELEPGNSIDFAFLVHQRGDPMELRCGGKVVRIERRGTALFAAATIDSLAIWRGEELSGREQAPRQAAAARVRL